jgi:hypothetical protein
MPTRPTRPTCPLVSLRIQTAMSSEPNIRQLLIAWTNGDRSDTVRCDWSLAQAELYRELNRKGAS